MKSHPINGVVSAFTEDQVSKLTGITVHRLRYWDRTAFFRPAYGADNRRLPYSRIYSFSDVTALRTLAVLSNQHNIPLQHLRQVSDKLGVMDNTAWSRTTLYVLNRRVIFVDPEVKHQREIVSGQYMIGIPLEKIVSDTRRDVRELSTRDENLVGQIVRHRRVSHNVPVIAGTRIPVRSIKAFAEAGYTVKQILKEYPTLKKTDVEAAIRHDEAA